MAKKNPLKGYIPNKLYFKIGEVSSIAEVEPYVLRYWESEFKAIKPSRTQSKQRIYRKKDVELILEIKKMLYEEKLTIAGARKKLREFNSKDKKQLRFDFNKKDQRKILREIKNELMSIRELLG
ncbi:MAG: MerR family transcriptional regulator [Deltaproteobacteria bacterium]|nr:MerR family transcriptional regulator [Deltaproteobacteria bacterium]